MSYESPFYGNAPKVERPKVKRKLNKKWRKTFGFD